MIKIVRIAFAILGVFVVLIGIGNMFFKWPDDVTQYTGSITFNTIEEQEDFGIALLDEDIKIISLSSTKNSPLTTSFQISALNGKDFNYGSIDTGNNIVLLVMALIVAALCLGLSYVLKENTSLEKSSSSNG